MKIKLIFEPCDLWVGLYYDRKRRVIYLLPVPCIGLRISLAPREGCDFCRDPDGVCCFPHYGLAPHQHDLVRTGGVAVGSTVLFPESEWPANFKPDPDVEGCGVYEYCPKCGAPEYDQPPVEGSDANVPV